MIIDKLLSPAIKVALSTFAVATTTIVPPGSGQAGVMDFGAARNNGLLSKTYGPGWDINFRGGTSGGAATAQLLLVTDDNVALSSPTTLYTSAVFTLANTVKTDLFVPIIDTNLWERFVAWRLVVGTAVFTGGTLSVEFVADVRNWRAYPAQGNR
jgi:hypothetical protein